MADNTHIGDGFWLGQSFDGEGHELTPAYAHPYALNGNAGIFVHDGLVHIVLPENREGRAIIKIMDPNGGVIRNRDLSGEGVSFVFGVTPFKSQRTGTWKVIATTYNKPGTDGGSRGFWIEDTKIPVSPGDE